MRVAESLSAVQQLAAQIFGEVDAELGHMVEPSPVPTLRRERPPLPRDYRWKEKSKRVKHVKRERPQPNAGEMRLIDFLHQEMGRAQRSRQVIYERLISGYYKDVVIRRTNGRNMFVTVNKLPPMQSEVPLPGEVWMKDFAREEAERDGVCIPAVYNRLHRGGYPDVTMRRVNRRTVFVKRKTIQEAKAA